MFFKEVSRALVRRWYLLALGLAVAISAGYLAWTHVGSRYSSEVSVLLLPPLNVTKSNVPGGRDGNPLLYLGGLGQARDVLIGIMSSDAQGQAFEDQFPDSSFTVTPDFMSSGPIVVLKVDTPGAATAEASISFLTDRVQGEFKATQASLGVKNDAAIRTIALTSPTDPEPDQKAQLRISAITTAGVIVVSLLLIALIDGLLRTRGKRRIRPGMPEESQLSQEPSMTEPEAPAGSPQPESATPTHRLPARAATSVGKRKQ